MCSQKRPNQSDPLQQKMQESEKVDQEKRKPTEGKKKTPQTLQKWTNANEVTCEFRKRLSSKPSGFLGSFTNDKNPFG